MLRRFGSQHAGLGVLLALSLAAPVAALEVEIGLNFTATDISEAEFFIPPDSQLAVGEEHLVELLNGRYAVYRKSDGVLLQSDSLDGFWVEAGVFPDGFSFDPRVLYDASSARWFAVSADGNPGVPNSFLVAVSKSSDPTAGWTGFAVPSDSSGFVWADFPTLAVSGERVLVSADMFNFGDTFVAPSVLVIPLADLLAPLPSIANATLFERVTQLGVTPQPVVDLDESGGPGILLSDFSLVGFLVRTDVAGDAYAPTLQGPTLLATQGFAPAPPAPQPGSKPGLEAGNGVLANFDSAPVLRGGSIWAVSTVNAGGRPALRWLEIDATTNEILQTGVLAHPELGLYYGSIAVNEHGQVVIGCSGSSETQFVSSYAIVGETEGGVTTFGEPILLRAGEADYFLDYGSGRNRWGDYSATMVDPSDSRVFWTIQEFVLAEDVWATQITELRLGNEIEVEIDIKPGLAGNPVNPRNRGVLPVALLGSASFAVADVDGATLAFGPSGASPSGGPALEDVNADGFVDLLVHFRTQASGIASGDTEACLTGTTLDGTDFRGCDAVRIVPSCGLGFEVALGLGLLLWLHRRRHRAPGFPA
jgi:hypothetical protein